MFYEIPVPRPWDQLSEYEAYQHTIEQAVAGEKAGFDSFWTVEHHFLEEYSHCSNPEVLYGAIAARTERMRLGYGVRLMPKPYNHPVRSAESAATLDLISGRPGRVRHRPLLDPLPSSRGSGSTPSETRAMWQEAIGHVVGCWTNDEYEFEGEYWSMPKRRVLPKPLQDPHPPLWGATGSPETHRLVGQMGLGLLSFSVGTPAGRAEEADRRLPRGHRRVHRAGREVRQRPGGQLHDGQRRPHPRGVAGRGVASPSSGTRSTGPGSSGRSPSGCARSSRSSAPTTTWPAPPTASRTARSTC